MDRVTRPRGGNGGAVQSTGTEDTPAEEEPGQTSRRGAGGVLLGEQQGCGNTEGPTGGQGLTMRVGAGVTWRSKICSESEEPPRPWQMAGRATWSDTYLGKDPLTGQSVGQQLEGKSQWWLRAGMRKRWKKGPDGDVAQRWNQHDAPTGEGRR